MDVDSYIKKQKMPQKEILEKLRAIIKKNFKGLKEEIKMGVPWYEGKYYLVGLRDSVNMGFCVTGLKKEQMELLNGLGKYMRHLKFKDAKEIDEKKIVGLMKAVKTVNSKNRHPFKCNNA
jgi:hypothetical protein